MGFANTVTVVASAAGVPSRAVNLDWMNGTPVGVMVTSTAAAGAFAYTVQYTLSDLMFTASSLVTWVSDPNATALTSNSSGVLTYTAPLAGIRLNSTTTPANVTMQITQGSWL